MRKNNVNVDVIVARTVFVHARKMNVRAIVIAEKNAHVHAHVAKSNLNHASCFSLFF